MKKVYLVLFNGASCALWGFVLYNWVLSVLERDQPEQLWARVNPTLKIVQAMALMEIVHSALRVVRSPLFTTFLQVWSRIWLLFFQTDRREALQQHWSVYLFIGSWALAEIPRYFFYVLAQFGETKKLPWVILFVRYSLFLVLYPTGISGELIQMALRLRMCGAEGTLGLFYGFLVFILMYAPCAPLLYMHMLRARKKVLHPRPARPPRPAVGMQYPLKNGERRTMPFNQGVWVNSLEGIDDAEYAEVREVPLRKWRNGYTKYAVKNVLLSCKDKETCLAIARKGLEHVHNTMRFIRGDDDLTIGEAMEKFTEPVFQTGVIHGEKPMPDRFELSIPYLGEELKGQEIVDQCDDWVRRGVIEPDCGKAIAACVGSPWCDLRDKYFVLLGATSAMGPLSVLLNLGANVIAVDLNRDFIWKKLIAIAKDSCGTVYYPIREDPELVSDDDLPSKAGCDLLMDTPEIATWLSTVCPGHPLVIGGYAYLDGALFLKLSVAMDAIMASVMKNRKDVGVAFLCTPTDCFAVPSEAYEAQRDNYKNAQWYLKLFEWMNRTCLHNRLMPSPNARGYLRFENADGDMVTVTNGLVNRQGPNYCLSKRIQHWRCIVAHEDGHFTSSNIAPSTRTVSVTHNWKFAAAYSGLHLFKPMEVMDQTLSNAVMGALLIHDVCNPNSDAQPETRFDHPFDLFKSGSFHGGIWRCGYQIEACALVSSSHYMLKHWWHYAAMAVSGVVGLAAFAIVKPPHTYWK